MNWYQKQQLTKIAQSQSFDWKGQFLAKLQDILKNHKSKATMMAFLTATIFPMIDGFQMDETAKGQLKNDVIQVEEQMAYNVDSQNQPNGTDYQNVNKSVDQPLTTEQIQENKEQAENDLINSTMKMTKFFESGAKPDGYKTVYPDSKGIPTIGHGLNLTEPRAIERINDLGLDYNRVLSGEQSLTQEQIDQLFREDIVQGMTDAKQYLPNFDNQPPLVQRIITDMSFNMGINKMNDFKGMRNALLRNDYDRAAEEMKYSNADTKVKLTDYYKDTGRRAKSLYNAMKNLGNQKVK
jgi:GH24 family phage-related lysozyme (muramidase)